MGLWSQRVRRHRGSGTHHVVDIFEDGGEAADDQGELVLGDVDQTLLVVLCAHFGVCVLVSDFDGKLERKERESKKQLNKKPSVRVSVMKSDHDRTALRALCFTQICRIRDSKGHTHATVRFTGRPVHRKKT